MQLNSTEISELIKKRIAQFNVESEARNTGTIVSVSDGIIRIHGLSEVMQGEMIALPGNRYAMALNLERDSVGAVVMGPYADLAEVVKNETMQAFLTGSFSAQKLADTVISICGEQLDQYGQNLVRLMAENKRLTVLPAVLKEFQRYVEEHQAITEVQVTSAQPLSVAQQEKIAAAMEKRLAQKVKLNCNVDKTLIAGVIIRTEDFVIDGSSRGQLARLANELQL